MPSCRVLLGEKFSSGWFNIGTMLVQSLLLISDQPSVENTHQGEESLFGSLLRGLWYNPEKQSATDEQIVNGTAESHKDVAGKA